MAEISRKSSYQSSHNSSRKKDSENKSSGDSEQQYSLHLYCAVYTPQFGNYYHWAFAVYDEQFRQWHVYDAVQDGKDGLFRPEHRQANPRNSFRCKELEWLTSLASEWGETIDRQIMSIPVPGEAASWNCQDYVTDVWDAIHAAGALNENYWYAGKEKMLPYYGQDFRGGDGDDDYDEGEITDESEAPGPILWEEFVEDSDA